MDARSLALILYSRSQLEQDLKNSNEFKLLKSEFKNTIWESTIDRFHIQDIKIKNNLLNFILTI